MTVAGRLIAGILALVAIGISGPGLMDAALPAHPRPGIRRGLVILLGLCVGVSLWAAVGLAGFFIHKSSPPALMAGDAALSIIAGIAIFS
ncbi:MAG TPA: hypothetical protein VFC46_01445, partial [Humisphaera sp.]|nr:hypothetical protein [Humisphaera sp.]